VLRLRWSDTVREIKVENPGVPITVWCDEDTPLIWPEVLQAVSGHGPETELEDTDELLGQLMTEAGLARYHAYCTEHPPQSVSHRRRIVTAFLEKFGRPDQVSFEIKSPGWSEELVDDLTRIYLEDVERIARDAGRDADRALISSSQGRSCTVQALLLPRRVSSGLRLRSAMTLRITLVS
jgi:hypothetical protein